MEDGENAPALHILRSNSRYQRLHGGWGERASTAHTPGQIAVINVLHGGWENAPALHILQVK